MGFTRFISDDQLFVLRRGEDFVYLLKYINDRLLAVPKNSKLLTFVGDEPQKTYKMTTETNPANFVGLAITCLHIIVLSQPLYATTILERFNVPLSSPSYFT
jgi:hypothetical protein